jgi:hypothetical protein
MIKQNVTYSMEYYSILKRNEILIHGTMQMNLKTMLSEINWHKRVTIV